MLPRPNIWSDGASECQTNFSDRPAREAGGDAAETHPGAGSESVNHDEGKQECGEFDQGFLAAVKTTVVQLLQQRMKSLKISSRR